MKTCALIICLAFSAPVIAAVKADPSETLVDRATTQVANTLGSDWKLKGESCGKFRHSDQYQVRCTVSAEKNGMGQAYAVFFDNSMDLVALVRGTPIRAGKSVRYAFDLQKPVGYQDLAKEKK